ncbi:hypothetical protein Tco_0259960 [Tanacetum coccineum]
MWKLSADDIFVSVDGSGWDRRYDLLAVFDCFDGCGTLSKYWMIDGFVIWLAMGNQLLSALCPVCSVCEEDFATFFFRCDLAQLVLVVLCRLVGSRSSMDWYRSKSGSLGFFDSVLSLKVKMLDDGVMQESIYDGVYDDILSCSHIVCDDEDCSI